MPKALKMEFIVVLISSALAFLGACNPNQNNHYRPAGSRDISRDYLPKKDSGIINILVEHLTNSIRLYPISSGYDSFQLRIWFRGAPRVDSSSHMILLRKNRSGVWAMEKFDIMYPWYGGIQDIDAKPIVTKYKVHLSNIQISDLGSLIIGQKDSLFTESMAHRFRPRFGCMFIEIADKESYIAIESNSPIDVLPEQSDSKIRLIQRMLLILNEHPNLSFVKNHINPEL